MVGFARWWWVGHGRWIGNIIMSFKIILKDWPAKTQRALIKSEDETRGVGVWAAVGLVSANLSKSCKEDNWAVKPNHPSHAVLCKTMWCQQAFKSHRAGQGGYQDTTGGTLQSRAVCWKYDMKICVYESISEIGMGMMAIQLNRKHTANTGILDTLTS